MDVTKMDDEYVNLAQEAVEGLCAVTIPEGFVVNYVPIFRHLPNWFPGFEFNKIISRFRPIVEQMRNQPFDKIQQDMVRHGILTIFLIVRHMNPNKQNDGKATDSLTSSLIERLQQRSGGISLKPEDEELARNVAGVAYSGT